MHTKNLNELFYLFSTAFFVLCCRVERKEFSLAREIRRLLSHDVTVKPLANKKAVLGKCGSNNQQRQTG